MKGPEWRAMRYPVADPHAALARPPLAAGADTNDALAYYQLGDSVKWTLPGTADRAFYWALRLDPTLAEAYYARWDLRRHGTLYHLFEDGSVRRTDPRAPNDRLAVDSLLMQALVNNPFLDAALGIPSTIGRMRARDADRDPGTAGAWAYLHGDYRNALRRWGEEVRKHPEHALLHIARAYAWFHVDESDSAAADLQALIQHIERIQDSTVSPYLSKAFLFYSIGILRAGQHRYADARAAYENALLDNLGFYMAHVRLSAVALLLHDTTAALTELETASLIRGDDPVLLTFHGSVLIGAGRLDEGERQLRAALAADPEYAIARAFLGKAAEQRHDTTAARAAYRDYLAHGSRRAPEREWVVEELASLSRMPAQPH